ncbi:MAG: LCP family protein [Vallitalea sp.]|nr:LCP family protein [Vallitalea sp.]
MNNKGSLLTKFLQVFLISVVIFSLIVGVATGAYVFLNKDKLTKKEIKSNTPTNSNEVVDDNKENTTQVEEEKHFTTFAIFGVDKEGYRTDVVMVLTFNHMTKQMDIVSIPRDTQVKLSPTIYNELKKRRIDTPQVLKINEVPAYADKKQRNAYSVRVLEELFDIDIDYYVNMNLDNFRKIVDIISPIIVEIPKDMKYTDPEQGLTIDLKAGKQELYGPQAEQLIRYRKGYANGDIGRITMQHEFMKAFVNELLTDKNKLNIFNIATTVIASVDTNFFDSLDYINYISDISTDKLNLHNLPGTTKDGHTGFFYCDKNESIKLFRSFYEVEEVEDNNNNTDQEVGNQQHNESQQVDEQEKETEPEPEPEQPQPVSSKGLKIEVLNSTKVTGLAGRTKTKLQNNGFTISNVGNYRKESLVKTKIIIPNEGMGEDLSKFFKDSIIELKPEELTNGIDIRIIIGSNDSK